MSSYFETISIPGNHIQNVFGQFDKNIKTLEKAYHITIILRDDTLRLVGETNVKRAMDVINQLVKLSENGNTITEQNVNYGIALTKTGKVETISELDKDIICHTINGKPVKAKTIGQKKYIDAIDKNMIVFGVGPAGTGKTYLAMAKAINNAVMSADDLFGYKSYKSLL